MAKIPIILEPGRADGKLANSGAIFDENKRMFQSEINDIQDTLNSDNPNKPLSARQGKILKVLLDTKVIEAGNVPIDAEPTEGNETHIVTSDGIYKSLAKKVNNITFEERNKNQDEKLFELNKVTGKYTIYNADFNIRGYISEDGRHVFDAPNQPLNRLAFIDVTDVYKVQIHNYMSIGMKAIAFYSNDDRFLGAFPNNNAPLESNYDTECIVPDGASTAYVYHRISSEETPKIEVIVKDNFSNKIESLSNEYKKSYSILNAILLNKKIQYRKYFNNNGQIIDNPNRAITGLLYGNYTVNLKSGFQIRTVALYDKDLNYLRTGTVSEDKANCFSIIGFSKSDPNTPFNGDEDIFDFTHIDVPDGHELINGVLYSKKIYGEFFLNIKNNRNLINSVILFNNNGSVIKSLYCTPVTDTTSIKYSEYELFHVLADENIGYARVRFNNTTKIEDIPNIYSILKILEHKENTLFGVPAVEKTGYYNPVEYDVDKYNEPKDAEGNPKYDENGWGKGWGLGDSVLRTKFHFNHIINSDTDVIVYVDGIRKINNIDYVVNVDDMSITFIKDVPNTGSFVSFDIHEKYILKRFNTSFDGIRLNNNREIYVLSGIDNIYSDNTVIFNGDNMESIISTDGRTLVCQTEQVNDDVDPKEFGEFLVEEYQGRRCLHSVVKKTDNRVTIEHPGQYKGYRGRAQVYYTRLKNLRKIECRIEVLIPTDMQDRIAEYLSCKGREAVPYSWHWTFQEFYNPYNTTVKGETVFSGKTTIEIGGTTDGYVGNKPTHFSFFLQNTSYGDNSENHVHWWNKGDGALFYGAPKAVLPNYDIKIPFGKWFTFVSEYTFGDENSGHVKISVIIDGEKKKVFDISLATSSWTLINKPYLLDNFRSTALHFFKTYSGDAGAKYIDKSGNTKYLICDAYLSDVKILSYHKA